MKTDEITIFSNMEGKREALEEAERFASYNGLTGKNANQLRLLTEETVNMVQGIVHDFRGNFWLESEKSGQGVLCRICVSADVAVTAEQEDELLSVSSSGKNESAKGITGIIRQMFRRCMQQSETAVRSGAMDMIGSMNNPQNAMLFNEMSFWSLQEYRRKLNETAKQSDEERDDLEKSIIANLADEVRVGIYSGCAEVIIEKVFFR